MIHKSFPLDPYKVNKVQNSFFFCRFYNFSTVPTIFLSLFKWCDLINGKFEFSMYHNTVIEILANQNLHYHVISSDADLTDEF
jgi:hypothetical protein